MNIFPKDPLHRIQVNWSTLKERKISFHELIGILKPAVEGKLFILPWRTNITLCIIDDQDEYLDRFFTKIATAYKNYLSNYEWMMSKEMQNTYQNWLKNLVSRKLARA